MRRISAAAARRYLVLRHLLAPPRALPAEPASVMRVFERLGSVQFDPLDVAGRNHDLVLAARIEGYRREWTDALLYETRELYETYNKGLSLVPTADLPWYRVAWDRSRARLEETTFQEHSALVGELLERIRRQGPLASTDFEARAPIEWSWRPTNQVRAVLEGLALAGVLGLARREGNRRIYDLTERLFPSELLGRRQGEEEALRFKMLSRVRGHGLLSTGGNQELWVSTGPNRRALRDANFAALVEEGVLEPGQVEGVKGVRYLPASDLPFLEQAERELASGVPPGGVPPQVAILGPLDPLVWDRILLKDLFRFDYLWEVYVTPAKRRWGYYVLPLLYGDGFAGRIELRADRRAGELQVLGLWWEPGAEAAGGEALQQALDAALTAHGRFLGTPRLAKAPAGPRE